MKKTVKSDYARLLLDPRWQKKRLEILSRDEWTCQICGDTESTLHVHHKFYMPGNLPWEADDTSLVTLCADCHEQEGQELRRTTGQLARTVLAAGGNSGDLITLAAAFYRCQNLRPDDFTKLAVFIEAYGSSEETRTDIKRLLDGVAA